MRHTLAAALCSTAILAACSDTRRAATPMQPSGFLGPDIVARLQPTQDGVRAYINPTVDFRRYRRAFVEPVQFWIAPGATQLTAEQQQLVANAFYDALRSELSQVVEFAGLPGPGTLVITTAITAARAGGNPVLSTVSTFVPHTRILREGAAALTGRDPLTGGAAGELRVTDAQTGDLLAAAIDTRDATAGARITRDVAVGGRIRASRWDDVVVVSQHWARRIASRLCGLQQRQDCREA